MAFLSIIIPFYKKYDFINRCIHSIINQDFQDSEIIIVDDGSPIPLSDDILNPGFKEKVDIYRIENSGPGFARNFGASKSRGEFLLFLDADDYLSPGSLNYFLKNYQEYPQTECFLYSVRYLSQASLKMPFLENEMAVNETISGFKMDKYNLPQLVNFFAAGGEIIRKKIFLKLGGYFDRYNARFGEDAYLWIQLVLSDIVIFRSRYCFANIDDSASELGIGLKENRPIPVYLKERDILKEKINESKIQLFNNWINFNLKITVIRLINENRDKELAGLLFQYPGMILQKGLIFFYLKKTIKRFIA